MNLDPEVMCGLGGPRSQAVTEAEIAHNNETLAPPRVISISDVPNRRSFAVMKRLGRYVGHEAELDAVGDVFPVRIFVIDAPVRG
ncbi:hypothetical protein [Sinisalibacter aestuarii]|uniref:hypothetical protein n=1 Tax=Sinisalibacter aestuarii TaxID=2949426 RepID=UPI002492CC11|nr:hypothetical protein [Sinisalibacter aestuarii]